MSKGTGDPHGDGASEGDVRDCPGGRAVRGKKGEENGGGCVIIHSERATEERTATGRENACEDERI